MAGSDAGWAQLEQIPALPPPPGVQSDFDHPETRKELAKIVAGLTYALMLVFLTLRIYARIRVKNCLGVDDYLSLAAGASITAFTGLSFSLFGNPLGPHQWNVPLSRFNANFLGRTLSSMVLFSLSSLFVKTALLSLYLRVFAPNRVARMLIWIGVATIVAFYTVSIIINICFCVPLSMTTPVPDMEEWARKLEASNCSQPVYNLNAAVGLFGVVSDLYVLIIPVTMVYSLRIPRSRKFGIMGIFLTGLLYDNQDQRTRSRLKLLRAVASSVTSTAFRFLQLDSYDFTWDSIPSYTLRAAELNIGLICSCMPVVFAILKKMFQARRHSPKRRAATPPHIRTPSHAYISDLRGSGYSLNRVEDQPQMAQTPDRAIDSISFTQQPQRPKLETAGQRLTYTELGSTESNDSKNLRDPG